MKRGLVILSAGALAATAAAWASPPRYYFAGMWGDRGSGPGEFIGVNSVAVAPNGNVYVTDWKLARVQYFTPSGSYLGQWTITGRPYGIDNSPAGVVYVVNNGTGYIQYFTPTGALLGQWGGLADPIDVAVAPNGNVYVTEWERPGVSYYTSSGSLLGSWGKLGNGNGEFKYATAVGIAANGNVYVTDENERTHHYAFHRVQYFTSSGSYLGQWGDCGSGEGYFDTPTGVHVTSGGTVFIADCWNNRVQYFTPTGSFLGKFGWSGEHAGEFNHPVDVDMSPSETRVYVTDYNNYRVQYFGQGNFAVCPASLGQVKALFK